MTSTNRDALIEVRGLKTHFFTDEGVVKAVDGVDFVIPRGKTLCVVGESGSGKSIMARSLLKIVDPPGRIIEGEVLFYPEPGRTVNITLMDPKGPEIRKIRGKEISMIFQEPMSALSPVHTIGNQIMEMILLHLDVSKKEARDRTIDVLGKVGLPKPEQRIDAYTFQLSGGMRQRAMVAMALACEPKLLIADEPTTALDVTTQAIILDLIRGLQQDLGMSVMFITHDLGVVAEIADDVVVMYLGTAAERGDVDSIFHEPKHPYTQALLRSIPKLGLGERHRLESIRGLIPHPFRRPTGCSFSTRCDFAIPGVCDELVPPREVIGPGRDVRCLLYSEVDKVRAEQQTASGKVLR